MLIGMTIWWCINSLILLQLGHFICIGPLQFIQISIENSSWPQFLQSVSILKTSWL